MKINNLKRVVNLPDVVLFDLDNTLYPYNPAHKEAHQAIKNKITKTLSISNNDFERAFIQAKLDIKGRLKNTASSHNRLLYMQRMLEILGLGSQVLMALDLEQTYWRTFLSNAILFEDVKALMDDIRLLGITIGIVTDLTAQVQFRKIVYFGLEKYLDFIVTSEESGFDKPHESSFNIALKKMQLKSRGNIWMIGDHPINDIRGSRDNINAITFQKIHSGVILGVDENAPDVFFEKYAELRKLVKKLTKK